MIASLVLISAANVTAMEERKVQQNKTIVSQKTIDNIRIIKYHDHEIAFFNKNSGQQLKTQDKKIVDCDLIDKILIIEYQNNEVDLFDTASGQKINPNQIQAQKNKKIYSYKIIGNILIIRYGKDGDYNHEFDLFDIKSGQQIKQRKIPANKPKFINRTIDLLNKNGLHINQGNNQNKEIKRCIFRGNILIIKYNDHELGLFNEFDLFNIKSGQRIKKYITNKLTNKLINGKCRNILIIECDDNEIYFFDNIGQINKNKFQAQKNKTIDSYDIKGNILIIRYLDHKLDLFNIHSGLLIKTQPKIVSSCTTRKNILIIKYDDHELGLFNEFDLFNIKSGQKINTNKIQAQNNKKIVCYTIRDNILIIEYHNNEIDLFNINGQQINPTKIQAQHKKIYKCTTSDNILIIRYYNRYYNDNEIHLFDINSGNQKKIQANNNKRISVCTTRGNILIIIYSDREIDLFDIKSEQQINKTKIQAQKNKTIDDYKVIGNILIIVYDDNETDSFNIKTRQRVNQIQNQAAPIRQQPQGSVLGKRKRGDSNPKRDNKRRKREE